MAAAIGIADASGTAAAGRVASTVERLLARQNADGGWSYYGGGSWTEPTCYALLGLWASGVGEAGAMERALKWLQGKQNSDGGFSPRDGVQESTWVTALALLLPQSMRPGFQREQAERWLLASSGQESSLIHRIRLRLLGIQTDPDQAMDGWPWYPGTAGWVAPTALSILALEKVGTQQARERVEQGRKFLLARRCRDLGWNHGSTHALGYESDSYPETTGVALLGLHGVELARLSGSVARAQSHLSRCRSREAASWLRLGLAAHGIFQEQSVSMIAAKRDSTVEIALDLAVQAAASGRHIFLEA